MHEILKHQNKQTKNMLLLDLENYLQSKLLFTVFAPCIQVSRTSDDISKAYCRGQLGNTISEQILLKMALKIGASGTKAILCYTGRKKSDHNAIFVQASKQWYSSGVHVEVV